MNNMYYGPTDYQIFKNTIEFGRGHAVGLGNFGIINKYAIIPLLLF